MEILTVSGLLYFQESIQAIQKYRPELDLSYILPTFVDGRVKKSEEILSQQELLWREALLSYPVFCQAIRGSWLWNDYL